MFVWLRVVINCHPGCHGHSRPLLLARLFCDQNCFRLTFSSRSSPKNHYEVLGLEKTCSQADIKDAFLRLSKELHPDMQPSSQSGQQHSKFVRLNTAYSALNKPHSRNLYDAALVAQLRHWQASNMDGVTTDKPDGRVIYPDPHFWAYRNAGQGSAYDGSANRGLGVSNLTVATGVIIVMLIGMVVSYNMGNLTKEYDQRYVVERNRQLGRILQEARMRARANDRMAQVRALRDELIAEDALGQREPVNEADRNKRLRDILERGPASGEET